MTLSELMTELIKELKKSDVEPKQVEAYEGQFEDAKNFIIMPPAIFIDIPSGGKSELRAAKAGANISLYVCTSNLHSSSQTTTMLDAIEILRKELPTLDLKNHFRLKYQNFERYGNYPGFKVYQITFRAD